MNSIRRKVKDPKFIITMCVQGQSFYYQYRSLIGALTGYFNIYTKYKKYGTANFSLKEVF